MPGRNRFALLQVRQTGGRRSYYMSQTKQVSKRKRKAVSVSVLSVAGLSLAATTTGSEAGVPSPVQAFLGEEEISDVSLATFHLAGQENPGAPRSLLHLTRGGCGCGHGCGGCGHGCGGFGRGCGGFGLGFGRGCGCRGCRGCGRGCVGFGCIGIGLGWWGGGCWCGC
jgi:hypothetical protein